MWDALIAPGWSLVEKTRWFREAGLDTSTIKRLVVVECRKNLSILEPLCLNDSSMVQDASAFVAVARRLEYSAIEMLLTADDKANKALSELRGLKLRHEEAESEADSSDRCLDEEATISVGERLIRLYIRMYSLRTLGEIWVDQYSPKAGIRRIHFRTRLKNLREALLIVEKSLNEETAV